MSCGVGRRCSLDPELLWLWCRVAVTALIRPLAWEPPYVMGVALKKKKKKTKDKKKGKKRNLMIPQIEKIRKGKIGEGLSSRVWGI